MLDFRRQRDTLLYVLVGDTLCRRMTRVGRQEADDRRRTTGGRQQEVDNRRQTTKDGQLEAGNRKWAIGGEQPAARNWRQETGGDQQEILLNIKEMNFTKYNFFS
jgi:hypothetical protein